MCFLSVILLKKEGKINIRRQKKVEHLIRKEVEEIIRREVSDPRVGFFTITSVHITPDYKFVKIGISFLGGEEEREKGIDVLIKALNIVTEHYKDLNFKFYIIGHGLFQQKIKELAEKDARIIYIGMVDYKEMPKWYNQVDVIVIPSRTEGMPAVLLEAALCKRLVIVTPVGSMPLLVKNDKYGLITKKDDPQALVEAILRVLHLHQKQTDMLQKIVENAHRRARAILKLYLRNIGKHIPIEHLTYRYGS